MAPRIEQENFLSGLSVNRSEVCSFQPITMETGICKVLFARRATMLRGRQVVRFMRSDHIILVNQAILTKSTRSVAHQDSKGRGNVP